mmetsp:Transcript_11637/g.36867  ORF Transcript_11637/g.36867 Transcript_11637/m.36867 type:complete len:225 (+) Transcript_11637:364-1038(+)
MLDCPVIGPPAPPMDMGSCPLFTEVMSWMEDLRLSFLFMELSRMKYFWAWDATWVGVREMTKFRDMLRQSPLPNLASPSRKSLPPKAKQGVVRSAPCPGPCLPRSSNNTTPVRREEQARLDWASNPILAQVVRTVDQRARVREGCSSHGGLERAQSTTPCNARTCAPPQSKGCPSSSPGPWMTLVSRPCRSSCSGSRAPRSALAIPDCENSRRRAAPRARPRCS